jgi:aquaporin Z
VVINKYLAELVGTFILVIVGSMAMISAGSIGTPLLTVPFGFGLGYLAAYYSVGHVSGGHFNPAVTLAMFFDKRTSATDLVGYWISQFVGALLASLLLGLVTSRADVANTITRSPVGVGVGITSEIVLTAVLVLVFLSATRTAPAVAGIVISLTLLVVHFAGIPFSGSSVNPARSFAPAIIAGDLTDLWIYLVFPLIGGAIAWGLWQLFRPEARKIELGMQAEPAAVPAEGDVRSEPSGDDSGDEV